MLRYLIDEDLPRSLAPRLRSLGLDASDVRDVGLRGHADEEIVDHARAQDLVLVSGDLGFANALRYPPGSHPGIVVSRLSSRMAVDDVVGVIAEAIEDLGDDVSGALAIVEKGRVRLRR